MGGRKRRWRTYVAESSVVPATEEVLQVPLTLAVANHDDPVVARHVGPAGAPAGSLLTTLSCREGGAGGALWLGGCCARRAGRGAPPGL